MTTRQAIINWCNQTLHIDQFKDYAPNGLQIEGRDNIKRIITAVTASQAAINYAIEQQADMILVHHGFFWKSEPTVITGWKKNRIASLINNNINMAGYHLPLDAHPTLGNNAQLAIKMNWQHHASFGEQNLLNIGMLPENQQTLPALLTQLEQRLDRKPIYVGTVSGSLKTVAWCTGGAQGYFQAAIEQGAQVYITGEISEAQYHLANETNTVFISAGHHATERYGIQALGAALVAEFGVEHRFFDEANPA
ncbi:MAG: Nif3-like dinuclear metal center hexameric protein [Alysiella sp.]|uniref:Nif3-like dinuclear metal center hexameric protein n=1 Tax=Alysiella sp. TaxID=1872483 RepID=UPI0026DB9DC3|nr:Nif3-like dinuclear metal center hexameric protein [Alysiella sp.]MDO4433372.1 Nif3-like dinuclear metal center hexameric protein [Alysiella sp.]